MGTQDPKMMNDFRGRAQPLLSQMKSILDKCEGDFSQIAKVGQYARIVDLIVLSSRTFGQVVDNPQHPIHRIGDYSQICRSVAQQTSEIVDNTALFDTAVALLQDATDVLSEMVKDLGPTEDPVRRHLNQKLVERLQWLAYQFRGLRKANAATEDKKLSQNDIDDLLKKLGVA